MKYYFSIDNRRVRPIRNTWEEAAQDAVNAECAVWKNYHTIILDDTLGAEIIELIDN